MYMVFQSDCSVQRKGFNATHKTLCGGRLLATDTPKYLYSHAKYDELNYDNNIECEWRIAAKEGKRVKFYFISFEIEDETDCRYDHVDIFDGGNDTDHKVDRYCGSKLHEIYEYTKDLTYTDTRSPEYRLQGVILDISTFRLFQAVRSDKSEEKTNRPFIKVRFANKGIDKLNLGQILNHKTVTEKTPPYFKRKEDPCISFSYTLTVASKIYNYKRFLQCIDLSNPSLHPLPCECSSSDFNYSPCRHVITGDLIIVENDKLRELLKKGPKYRESMSFTWKQNVKIIMDSCEEYPRRWAKKEDVQLDTLSEWIKSIRGLLLSRIYRLKSTVNTSFEFIFKDPDIITELTYPQEQYVITPADKASNNYTFTCKQYYFDSLVKELGLNSIPGNPTYTPTNLSDSEIIDNHKSALASFGFDTNNLDLDLPYLNCIPKMHKNPYKQRFIAGSSKCSTKSVSILLTKVLSEIKSGLQKYYSTVYSRSGINQMWILKNSK
ncbi:hypothetical protein FSP39_021192 [Pinctada imbricata]|uniref:CUB domain-containing protein n=1 Tax=Pinctada imbricata TaxID=66713 RepID=A0AA88XWD0_PINIB|nr:hypothetical protein FSP39_021192 [Pinctada imbricata]